MFCHYGRVTPASFIQQCAKSNSNPTIFLVSDLLQALLSKLIFIYFLKLTLISRIGGMVSVLVSCGLRVVLSGFII